MFTGLVTDIGTIVGVTGGDRIRRVRIASRYPATSIAIGASIACGGCCLTAVDVEATTEGSTFDVDVGAETLERTTAGAWRQAMRLNLERSLRVGDELGGHIVTGHVDGRAEIVQIEAFEGMSRIALRVPDALLRFVAEKGSICLDGTSLTINAVHDSIVSVLLIPHTAAVTTWGERRPGDELNLEVDLMARYAARLIETAPPRVQ